MHSLVAHRAHRAVVLYLVHRLCSTGDRVSPATRLLIQRSADVAVHRNRAVIMIGSCFSCNIGTALQLRKFNVQLNPQGIQFNPLSIASTLHSCVSRRVWQRDDLTSNDDSNDVVYSFQHHTSFSTLRHKADTLICHMNAATAAAHKALACPNAVLFLTLGTTKTYLHLKTNSVVSNCHKHPGKEFVSRFLTSDESFQALEAACLAVRDLNPSVQIVFTVSPVRHTRDGVVNSSKSKAALICAVDALVAKYPLFVSYFPAYEVMMDELRDYRWYNQDMVHPSDTAVQYIYELFEQAYMDESSIKLSKEILKIQRDIAHMPLVPDSQAHKAHLQRILRSVAALVRTTPPSVASGLDVAFSESCADISSELHHQLNTL